MKLFKKIIIYGLIFLGISVLFVWWANHKIETETKNFVSYDIQKLPNEKVGLLLGTSKILKVAGKISTFSTELMQQNNSTNQEK